MTTNTARHHHLGSLLVWGGAAVLFLLPAFAMRFTRDVNWTALDFITWAALLASAGGAYELLARKAPDWTYRAAAAVAVGAAFLLVWVNLAVGIIGSEQNDANMMFAGVLALAVGGACVARLRAGGMARAMLATAAAQLLVMVVALALGLGAGGPIWPRDVIGGTGLFTALWLLAAWLFSRAAVRHGG